VTYTLGSGDTVTATDPDGDGVYTARVGSTPVTGVRVQDDCGNTGG